jgi:hypothetical protein
MTENLLKDEWAEADPIELRTFLSTRLGEFGQYSGEDGDTNRLFLPLAGDSGRIVLRFRGNKISAIEAGPAFDAEEWSRLGKELCSAILEGSSRTVRAISFSSSRVEGSWRGARSGVQILPPPKDAPSARVEIAAHPFVLEFPMRATPLQEIMHARRHREHRRLTLLLNVLVKGRISLERRQSSFCWVWPSHEEPKPSPVRWQQRGYFADFGAIEADQLSPDAAPLLEVLAADEYYESHGGIGGGLRIPTDLDESICRYQSLTPEAMGKFDRALYWLDIASEQWDISMSASFASRVSAVEALTVRGSTHTPDCRDCGEQRSHDVPGPTALFRNFFETYAPQRSLASRRNRMYDLRSGILHGSSLLAFDVGAAIGWDPPWRNQSELHRELWSLTRIAMRNWLRNPVL